MVRQYVNNLELLDTAERLEIVQIGTDPGYYLLQFDTNGTELTDTYHKTLLEAQEQAELEFGVSVSEWIIKDAQR